MKDQQGLIAEHQEACLRVTFSGQFQPIEHHVGRVIPAHGVDRQGERVVQGQQSAIRTGVTPGEPSDADSVLKRLAGRDHLTAIIVAAVAADVMGAFQFAAIAAFRVGFYWQSLMAAPHPRAGRRRLTFRNSHGTESFVIQAKGWNTREPRRLADRSQRGKVDVLAIRGERLDKHPGARWH